MGLKIKKIEGGEESKYSSKNEEMEALYIAYLDKIKGREGEKWDKKKVEVKDKLDKLKK